jgi:ATP-dependent Clp protease adaptor protein ClpS
MKNDLSKENTGYPVSKGATEEPSFYQIVIHHDDFTPMEFLLVILEKMFFMDRRQAAEILLKIREKGRAVCGVYSRDIAESKVEEVRDLARDNEYPLFCSMEAA